MNGSTNRPKQMRKQYRVVGSSSHPPHHLPIAKTPNRAEHVPPAVCFTVIPIAQIYLFAFRSRGKASLPFFGNVRFGWSIFPFAPPFFGILVWNE